MLINIMGLAGAGKDTVSDLLAQELRRLDYSVEQDKYAAPIKAASLQLFGEGSEGRDRKEKSVVCLEYQIRDAAQVCLNMLGLHMGTWTQDDWQHYDAVWGQFLRGPKSAAHDRATFVLSPRQFQQYLGTEIVRRLDSEAFVRRIAQKSHSVDFLLVSDCRFKNEERESDVAVYVFRNTDVDPAKFPHASEKLALQYQRAIEGCALLAPQGTLLLPTKIAIPSSPRSAYTLSNQEDLQSLGRHVRGFINTLEYLYSKGI